MSSVVNSAYNFITSKPISGLASTAFHLYNTYTQYGNLSNYYNQQSSLINNITIPSIQASFAQQEAVQNIQMYSLEQQAAIAQSNYLEQTAKIELSKQQLEQSKEKLNIDYQNYLFNKQLSLQQLQLEAQKTKLSYEAGIKSAQYAAQAARQAGEAEAGSIAAEEAVYNEAVNFYRKQAKYVKQLFSINFKEVNDWYNKNIWNLDITKKQQEANLIKNYAHNNVRLFGSAVVALNNYSFKIDKMKNDYYRQFLNKKSELTVREKMQVGQYSHLARQAQLRSSALAARAGAVMASANARARYYEQKASLLSQQKDIVSKMYENKLKSVEHDIDVSKKYIDMAYKNIDTSLKWQNYQEAKLQWMHNLTISNLNYQQQWLNYEKEKTHQLANYYVDNAQYHQAFLQHEADMAKWGQHISLLENIFKMRL